MRLIYLFFKQGFKSVFTYKIQFFVVIFLAFFASFYLATAMSLTQRLNQAYDNVVGKYEKFDYTYTRKMNESNLMSTNTTFLPILDFLPTQLNYATYGDEVLNDSFNLVLNNFNNIDNHGVVQQAGYTENFITKAFFDETGAVTDDFQEIWKMEDHNEGAPKFWESFGKLTIDGNKGTDQYEGALLNLNFSSPKSEIQIGSKGEFGWQWSTDIQNFIRNTTNLLAISLHEELKAIENREKEADSLIGNYLLSGGFTLEQNQNNIPVFNNPTNIRFDYETAMLSEIEVYIYNALETIPLFLLDKIRSFMNSSYSELVSNPDLVKPWKNSDEFCPGQGISWVESFNKKAEEMNLAKLSFAEIEGEIFGGDYLHPYGEEIASIIEYNANLAFEYIFGQSLNSTSNINIDNSNPYIVTDEDNLYVIKANQDDINEKTYANISVVEQGVKPSLPGGLRGSVNPMTISRESIDGEIVNGTAEAKSSSSFLPWEKLDKGQTFSSEFGGKKYDDIPLEYKNKNVFNLNLFHEKMAASYAGINLSLREEAFLYDQNSKTNFRFVVVDPKYDYNYTIMAGTEAMSDSEIVISQQYAFKNGYEIGDTIRIGASEPMIISGFGSDVLTYYPLVDPEVPVSDVSNSVIVYIPKTVLKSIVSKGNPNDFQFSTYYFMKGDDSKRSSLNLENKVAMYDSLLMNNKNSLNVMYESSKDQSISIDDIESSNNIKHFEDTTFDLNWELQPQLIKIINIICIVSSVFILIMAFIAIVFAIKKSIDHNASQIGYLKAIGSSAYKISVSYIIYSLLIGFIVVPLAWLSAGFFQEVLSQIFSTYFSSTLYEFIFDPKMLGLLMAVFGIGALVFSYIVALYLTGKNVLKIIHRDSAVKNYRYTLPWVRSKVDKLSFKVRFPMHISGRGWKQVLMITSTSFVVTIIVSLAMSIPSVLTNYINDATKYFTYKNAYNLNEPIVNMPISRPAISSSKGIPTTEASYVKSDSLAGVSDLFFSDVKEYSDSNWDTSFFPTIIMDKENNFKWFEEWALKSDNHTEGSSASDKFILAILNTFLTKIPNLNGASFSAGGFERITNWFWTTNVDPISGKKYNDDTSWNQEIEYQIKKEQVAENSLIFNELIPQLISMLQGTLEEDGIEFEIPEDASWKEQIILLAMAFLPSTGQQYLKDSPNRASQFVIGLNVENYTPGVESLSTVVNAESNNGDVVINGLKDNQMAYHLDEIGNTNDVFINDGEVLTQLETLFNTNGLATKIDSNGTKTIDDIVYNGMTIYNADTQTLTIPTITNLKSNEVYNFNNNLKINSFNKNVLKVENDNEKTVIPTNAWVYDNRELTNENEANSDSPQGVLLNSEKQRDWIPATEIDSNKLTYARQFITDNTSSPTNNKQLTADSQWFIKTDFDDNEISENALNYELRPYYHYNNLKIFIPKDVAGKEFLTKNQQFNDPSKISPINFDGAWGYNSKYWGGEIQSSAVPQIVKDAWGDNKDNIEYVWVAPFSINYGIRENLTNDGSMGSMDEINDGWIWADQGISKSGSSIIIENSNESPNFIKNINLNSVATLDTFNGNIVIVDQDILNLLTGRSINKYIPVNYDFYGSQLYTIGEKDLNIPVYETLTPQQVLTNADNNNDFFMKQEMLDKGIENPILYVAQNRDFTTKYSAYEEAFGVTTGFKGILADTPGIFPVKTVKDLDIINGIGLTYNNIELAGSELGVIISISESILMVSIFLIIGIILIAVLIITIMADVYVMKYSRFIITMKALGYKNKDIILSSLAIPTVISTMLMVGGYFIGIWLLGQGLQLAYGIGIFIPMVLHWWVPIVALTLVFVMFILSCMFSLQKPMKTKLTTLT